MFKNIGSCIAGCGRVAVAVLMGCVILTGLAQAGTADPRFSPRGIKGAIAFGSLDPASTQSLDEGAASTLRIGYGVNEQLTLWCSMTGSEHSWETDSEGRRIKADVGGLELSMQYAIPTGSRLQPFGRFGVGVYSMENRSSHDAWVGSGITFGLGADYFLSRHWSIGLETTYRGMDYSEGRVGEKGDFRELAHPIDGDASGIAFSVTLQ